MNVLTKLLIVVHVILTMLFVSAAIVFVNRVETFKDSLAQQKSRADAEGRRATTAEGAAQVSQSEKVAVQQQASAEIDRVRQLLNAAQAAMRERDTQLAQNQQNLASADARAQASTAALEVAQKSNSLLQDQLNQTREAANKTQEQNTELLNAIADKNQRLDVAVRQLRNTNEELEELRNQVADGGAPAAQAPAAGAPARPNPNEVAVNGEIRDQRNVNGVNYATISVGASDNVRKDMVFNVLDRETGDFLGYLKVDKVEAREASGRLEGPKVAEIKAGAEVRTQL